MPIMSKMGSSGPLFLPQPLGAGVGGGLGAWPPHALGAVCVQVHDVLHTVPAVDTAAQASGSSVRAQHSGIGTTFLCTQVVVPKSGTGKHPVSGASRDGEFFF